MASIGLAIIAYPVWADAPKRVISMNLCTDQLAMLVADPAQLLSVTYLAIDPMAFPEPLLKRAQKMVINHGLAEEIAFLRPDLVLAGRYTTRTTTDMLNRLGMPVVIIEPANSIADVKTNILKIGEVLHRQETAQALVAALDHALAEFAKLRESDPARVGALYYSSGYTSGKGSLGDELLATAGFSNIAEELALGAGGTIPLEALILQILIWSCAGQATAAIVAAKKCCATQH